MSNDVETLLGQLGQPDLEYRVFANKVETPGFWPIFRLVNANPALAHLPGARRRSLPVDTAASVAAPTQDWTGTDRRVGGPGKLFRRYAEQPEPTAAAETAETSDDIRGLLRRLSE